MTGSPEEGQGFRVMIVTIDLQSENAYDILMRTNNPNQPERVFFMGMTPARPYITPTEFFKREEKREIFENKIIGKKISGNMGNYKNFLLIDCIVSGNMNNIGGMLRGELRGNMNNVKYICGTDIHGNMNSIKYSFDYEDEQKKKELSAPSNLPPEIREAIEIRNEAMEFQKEVIEKTAKIEKRKTDYYKKYGTLAEKMGAYLKSFFS